MAKILEFWHQWPWAITCVGYIILFTAMVVDYRDCTIIAIRIG